MANLAERLGKAADALAAVTETPRLDAEILLTHALGIPRAQLLARLRDTVDSSGFDELVQRRLAFEPIAYIVGEWEFFSLPFHVEPPMLVPRPETEHLVEAVLSFVGGGNAEILEIGTGTGCVAVAVAKNAPQCRVTATDIRAESIELARRNACRHGVDGRIEFKEGDLFGALRAFDTPERAFRGKENEDVFLRAEAPLFDVICSNPPYIEETSWPTLSPVVRLHEDPRALLAGPDGLDVIRRLVCEAAAYLRPGGLLAFEMGMGQYDRVWSVLVENGYENVEAHRDLAGIERVAVARKPEA